MIIVHDIFICKPGNASKLVKLFKEVMADMDEVMHILTDVAGAFNKVVVVQQFESLAAFEESFKKYMKDSKEMQEMKEKMKEYQGMYLTGSREIYRVN